MCFCSRTFGTHCEKRTDALQFFDDRSNSSLSLVSTTESFIKIFDRGFGFKIEIPKCRLLKYEGESNENLKYFLNTIYCAEVVQKCITFQHNLPPTLNAIPPALTKCINSFRKKIILVVRATTHAPRDVYLHQNGTYFLPLLL